MSQGTAACVLPRKGVSPIACACGKNRQTLNGAARGTQFVYDYTAPGTEVPVVFGTPLEAKREVRKNGGGVIRRRQVAPAPAA